MNCRLTGSYFKNKFLKRIVLFLFLLHISNVFSQSLVISEVLVNPFGSETAIPGGRSNEFIELYNSTDSSINISGFKFSDGDAVDEIISWDTTLLGSIPLKQLVFNTVIIPAKSYAVILDPDYTDSLNRQDYFFPPGTVILTVKNTTLGDGLTSTDPLTLYKMGGCSQNNRISTFGTPLFSDDSLLVDDDGLDTLPFDPGDGFSLMRMDLIGKDTIDNWMITASTYHSTPGGPNNGILHPVFGSFGSILINEICTDPFQDWSAFAFDTIPGNGIADSTDEYIELFIQINGLNLMDWKIEWSDYQSSFRGPLTRSAIFNIVRYVGIGNLENTSIGDYLVLGHSLVRSLPEDLKIIILSNQDFVVDSIVLGSYDDGNLADNLPPAFSDSSFIYSEVLLRFPNGQKSSDPQKDFRKGRANPGLNNDNFINSPPTIDSLDHLSIFETFALQWTIPAVDPEGDLLTFTASPLPPGAILSDSVLVWTPDTSQAGEYWIVVEVTDNLAGKSSDTLRITVNNFYPAAPGELLITEVVTDPQSDWSTQKFSGLPDTGIVSETDEYIEIFNNSGKDLNIEGWSLRMLDATPDTEFLKLSKNLYFSDSLSSLTHFSAQTFLVIGNPDGSMTNDIYMQLVDQTGNVIDDVELGSNLEQDALDDGAPDGTVRGGLADDPSNESISRAGDTLDTADDVNDFYATWGTPGFTNSSPVTLPKPPSISDFLREPTILTPNPGQSLLFVHYLMTKAGIISINLYDSKGQRVRIVKNEFQSPASYQTNFSIASLPSGIYFLEFRIDKKKVIKKLTILK